MQTGTAVSQEPTILETRVPLSQSVIWRLQRDFYSRRGLKAWTEDGVPSYITSNPFIAEVYARIVAAFMGDCMCQAPEVSPKNPLRILELGAGTGKFAFLFLRKLTSLLTEQGISPRAVRYRLTECSEDMIAFWRSQSCLAEFVASGILEFELFRVGEESARGSPIGRVAATEESGRNPLVVIANYVFDSLPQDAFVVNNGQIYEALVTTSTAGSDPGPAPRLDSLQLSFSNSAVPPGRYPERAWNSILDGYRDRLASATVFFPSAALELLQQLGRTSDGRMLVLAADKGLTREEDLALRRGAPEVEFHASGQCFSTVVNFDAMARCFKNAGGEAFLPQKRFSNLSLCVFLQHGPEQDFPATRKACGEAGQSFGADDLFTLMDWLDSRLNEVSPAQALSILRLTRWDPTALLRLFPAIASRARNANAERNDLRDAVQSCRANHYPVGSGDNVMAFNCGVILLELRFFAEAKELFRISQQELGRSAATSYNLGLCSSGLGRADEALAFMVEACELDPAFEPARSARASLESQPGR